MYDPEAGTTTLLSLSAYPSASSIAQMIQPTDPGHQDGSLPADSTRKLTRRYSPTKPRASRKPKNKDPHDIAARISNLPPIGKKMMEYYAGNELRDRKEVLEKFEDYQRQYNDAPVVKVGTQWRCGFCPRVFKTLQKAAIHLVSNEWKLRPWHCACQRIYGSSNELTRHMNDSNCGPNVDASLPLQNNTMLPGAAVPPNRQATGTTQHVTQWPSLMASSANDMGHVPASVNRPSLYTQHPDIPYNRQFEDLGAHMFIGQGPRELPEATHPLDQSWNHLTYPSIAYPPQANEQLATSWGNGMLYQVPRRQDPFPGLPGHFQPGPTSEQLPIDAPHSSRRSNRHRGNSENRTNARSTSQNRPGAGTSSNIVRHRNGEPPAWGYPSGSGQGMPRPQ